MSEAAQATRASSVRRYCSEHNETEPLWGTADTVDVWLCLEYKPTWKARVFEDNALAEPTRRWLEETIAGFAAAGLKARPQFIRRPELDRGDVSLLVAHGGQGFRYSGQGYGFLETLDLPANLEAGDLGTGGERLAAPVYLVCTNGQRDVCCARFGLPVYNELKTLVGERVWQVTHLGGHRFAPNLLTLGDGCLYGRVTLPALPDFLADTESGRLAFPYLRGRSRYSKLVQAAEAALGRQHLRLLYVEGDDRGGTVQFALADGRLSITLARAAEAQRVQKSCGDPEADVYPYEVVSVGS